MFSFAAAASSRRLVTAPRMRSAGIVPTLASNRSPVGRSECSAAVGSGSGNVRHKVLLLGWTDCKPRYLEKYADLYDKLGCDAVLRTDHCDPFVLWMPWKMKALASELLDHVEKERPTAVHVFSNGGGLVWSMALKEARKRELEGGIRLPEESEEKSQIMLPSIQILDSGPGYFFDFVAGFKNTIEFFHQVSGAFSYVLIPLATAFHGLQYVVTLQWIPSFSVDRKWKEEWASDAMHFGIKKHLLLFSADDLIVNSKSVQEFAQLLRNRGAALSRHMERTSKGSQLIVREKIWEKSKHVQHFRYHPTEYQNELKEFFSSFETCSTDASEMS